MSDGTRHGHGLDDALHQQLRTPPPARVLEWLCAETGAAGVSKVRALEGGASSAVHLVRLDHGRGDGREVVLRRYVLDWLLEEPWAPANEVAALEHLRDQPVAAPVVVAADLDGSRTGVPTLAMSVLPGRVVWRPSDTGSWLTGLAELLPVVHAVPVSPAFREWRPYKPTPELVPPPWSRWPRAWEAALEVYASAPPVTSRSFLHRDFHPGNVLWADASAAATVTGLVDWVSACVGPPEEDVAHCRANLAREHSVAEADRFLERWLRLTGQPGYHPYFDLTTIVSMVTEEPDPGLDRFAAATAARL